MKIAINTCYGGFCLSDNAIKRLFELGCDCDKYGQYVTKWGTKDIERNDPRLIQVIEEMGDLTSGLGESVKLVEIPDDVKNWYIVEYDGMEHVAEGRTWGYEEE